MTEGEVIYVYEGEVWASRSLPKGFDLSKAAVISFEGDKIRFFDFQATEGGYYDRIWGKTKHSPADRRDTDHLIRFRRRSAL